MRRVSFFKGNLPGARLLVYLIVAVGQHNLQGEKVDKNKSTFGGRCVHVSNIFFYKM